jgi:hypothetical protein
MTPRMSERRERAAILGLLFQEVHEGLLEGFIVELGGLEQGLPREGPGFQDLPLSSPGYHPLTPLIIQVVVQGEGVVPPVCPRAGSGILPEALAFPSQLTVYFFEGVQIIHCLASLRRRNIG